jgi:hypothetical protein
MLLDGEEVTPQALSSLIDEAKSANQQCAVNIVEDHGDEYAPVPLGALGDAIDSAMMDEVNVVSRSKLGAAIICRVISAMTASPIAPSSGG